MGSIYSRKLFITNCDIKKGYLNSKWFASPTKLLFTYKATKVGYNGIYITNTGLMLRAPWHKINITYCGHNEIRNFKYVFVGLSTVGPMAIMKKPIGKTLCGRLKVIFVCANVNFGLSDHFLETEVIFSDTDEALHM